MTLAERITTDLKEAMKAGDKLRLETLRMIRASVLEFEKSGAGRPMTEDEEIAILNQASKKRRDAIEQFEKAGRTEMAEKERAELAIIAQYLPAQLSDDEIRAELATIIASMGATSPSDLGKVMGMAVKGLKGRADGSTIQRLARELLTQAP
ncbi:MAG TPA: glutamyl-tRNA amidotransferase [Bacteroidetes bacterium]|nr:glutamyl-tRNA amidotransferase [Bacteroidota bacterium]HRK04496.1 GatB/YqeY domain-containing protein [Chlorobiota bacterium]